MCLARSHSFSCQALKVRGDPSQSFIRDEAGVDVLYVSELLGRSSPAITMSIYQHVRKDRLNDAARRISDAIGV
jgi:integrase